jgi:hypothetical protein
VHAGTTFTNVDMKWNIPTLAEFFGHLASFSRLITFDKRGMEVSDPVPLAAISPGPPESSWRRMMIQTTNTRKPLSTPWLSS